MRLNKLINSKLAKLPDGYHSDGGNLYLRVKGGSRSWVFRYMQDGVPHELGLGGLIYVPINEARKRAAKLRLALANGETIHIKKVAQTRVLLRNIIFDAINWRYKNTEELRSADHYLRTYTSAAKQHINPAIGAYPIEELTAPIITDYINGLPNKSLKKSNLSILRLVFKYANTKQITTTPFPYGVEELVVPFNTKQKHFSSLPAEETRKLMKQLVARSEYVYGYIALVILTASRPGELMDKLKYENIDFNSKVFTLPITKNGAPFIVPYPWQAEVLLKRWNDLYTATSSQIVAALRQLTGGDYTMHGFRSTFSTWCADNGEDQEVREACLNHKPTNSVIAAYQRSNMLERRRVLLQKWADYLLK